MDSPSSVRRIHLVGPDVNFAHEPDDASMQAVLHLILEKSNKGDVSLEPDVDHPVRVHVTYEGDDSSYYTTNSTTYLIALLLRTGETAYGVKTGTISFAELADQLHAKKPSQRIAVVLFYLHCRNDGGKSFPIDDVRTVFEDSHGTDGFGRALNEAIDRGWIKKAARTGLKLTRKGAEAMDRG